MNRDMLVGLGGCLTLIGFVLRGFARGNRRDQALRRQHDLANDALDADRPPDALDRHLEKWVPRYGTACVAVGFTLIGVGLFG